MAFYMTGISLAAALVRDDSSRGAQVRRRVFATKRVQAEIARAQPLGCVLTSEQDLIELRARPPSCVGTRIEPVKHLVFVQL